jgi:uncharacterized membrane protein YgcG
MAEKESAYRRRPWNKSVPAHVKSDMATLHPARSQSALPVRMIGRAFIRRLTMKVSRLLSAVFVLLALALGSFAVSGCTSGTDSGASSTSGGSSSGGY